MHNIDNNTLVIQQIKQNENAQIWIHIHQILQHHHNNYNATYQLLYFSIFPSNIYIMYF
jgi:thiosulfate reductase cytochrome b subunit